MSTVESILVRLKRKGERFTGKRKAMVEILVANRKTYVTARMLFEEMGKRYASVSYDTVYRTLSMLREHRVIEEVELGNGVSKYRIISEKGHYHPMVCLACGEVRVLKECPMQLMNMAFEDFTVVHHRFELYGYCTTCQTSAEKEMEVVP